MMTSFSIDDVRDTMPREVTEFLARIERSSRRFLDEPRPAQPAAEDSAASLLRTIRRDGHAIYGTSALVSVKTLAACADLVEQLAERGYAELAEAERRASRARRMVELLPAGVQHMRKILALELKHETDEAEWVAAEWQGAAQALLSELAEDAAKGSLHPSRAPDASGACGLLGYPEPATEGAGPAPGTNGGVEMLAEEEIEFLEDEVVVGSIPAPGGDAEPVVSAVAANGALPPLEFSFEELEASVSVLPASERDEEEFSFSEMGDEPSHTNPTYAEVQRELLGIFQQEAREAVVSLQGYFDALANDPSNPGPAAPLERVYHTLKGAAATVGLSEVSSSAQALQHRAEALGLATDPIEPSTLSGLIEDTNRLFALAGLDGIMIAARAPATVARGNDTSAAQAIRRDFVNEAKEIHEQASHLVAQLSSPSGAKFEQSIVVTLAQLFHRLKGSALVASQAQIAELASGLEAACESVPPPSTAALSLGLARIALKLGLSHQRVSAAAVSSDPASAAATRASFQLEARELLEGAVRLTSELSGSNDSLAANAQQELARVFHHLRGSAGIVGEDSIASEAYALEGLLQGEGGIERPALDAINERLSTLRARFGVDSSAGSALSSPARARSVRERVDLSAAEELWQTFTAECAELMEAVERGSLSLEDSAAPKEHLRGLLRTFHTLKGVINTIGLVPTGRILHRIEDLLETLLEAPILPPARSIASLLLEAQSEVRRNLKEAPTGWVETSPDRLEQRIASLLAARDERSQASSRTARSEEIQSALSSRRSEGSVDGPDRRVIRVSTERLDTLMNLAGELVVSRSRLNNRVDRLRLLQTELVRGSRRLLQTVDAFREEHEFANLDGRQRDHVGPAMDGNAALAMQPAPRNDAARPAWSGFSELELDRYEGIHVLTRSLVELTSDFSDMYGQLARGLTALTDDSDVVGGIVSGIQTEVTQARMVPLDVLFQRLRLPLRDAAMREKKEVRVVVRGEDVPVDKIIADALFQPLLHLVRNAVVHGIESAEGRARAGKPRVGTIELLARQESGQIVIEVKDDGAGLDLPGLRARGVEMGLLSSDVSVDDPSVRELVFAQGLSTHQSVDDVAGRGVGGEVVKRAVDRLNGSIRVESRPEQGTAFLIRLPLTLAITRALVVRGGEQFFAIPLHFAERIIDAHEQEIVSQGELRRIKLDDTFMPIRGWGDFLGADGRAGEGPVLILRVGDARMALQVDQIVAHEEIVVKGLGSLLTGHPSFAGVTIRGTGQLVLIIDVPGLVEAKGSALVKRPAAVRGSEKRMPVEPVLDEPKKAALSAPSSRPVRVLFVDDSVSVRKVAEMQLKALGAEVTVAVDGMDAMSKLRENQIDLVFTDLEMPRMHGYELIRELRFLPAYKELPIIVVTSRSGQKHQDQARELGASEYITKPFTVQVLEAALKKWQRPDAAVPSTDEQGTQS
jgi:chemosensory pili system protein ChpA (sensor histidine kinase/response regulator)